MAALTLRERMGAFYHLLCAIFVFSHIQLENLVYFNRLKHSKIVISDFQLAKLENGLIKDPCGTPEYLGRGVSVGEFACLSIKI